MLKNILKKDSKLKISLKYTLKLSEKSLKNYEVLLRKYSTIKLNKILVY